MTKQNNQPHAIKYGIAYAALCDAKAAARSIAVGQLSREIRKYLNDAGEALHAVGHLIDASPVGHPATGPFDGTDRHELREGLEGSVWGVVEMLNVLDAAAAKRSAEAAKKKAKKTPAKGSDA